jgi:UDP-glucose-4-epimerase GalE
MDNTVLITGGAGYIGSHTVRKMADMGYRIVVLDNLVYGHPEAIVSTDVNLIVGDIGDREVLDRIFESHTIGAVIHFAAYAYVGESVDDPSKYYRNNLAAPLVLLDVMRSHGCDQFVFSSTCATYGNPDRLPIDESHPQNPINPYGKSKFFLERVLEDHDHAYGIRSAKLRYFNACGCADDGVIGEDHDPETHLIPNVLMSITGERDSVSLFGTDYETPDGTCIRDYIHVLDLANAHILALRHLDGGNPSFACNLGTGQGVSVQQIIDMAEEVSGRKVPVVHGDRRSGDPAELVADPGLAKEILGWEAEYADVRDSIRTAWNWMSQPHGGRFAGKRADEQSL